MQNGDCWGFKRKRGRFLDWRSSRRDFAPPQDDGNATTGHQMADQVGHDEEDDRHDEEENPHNDFIAYRQQK